MPAKKPALFACAALAVALWQTAPARAVELQQKWLAGQKLSYDVALDGTVNVQAPAEAAIFFAGIPLEAKFKAKSQTVLDTLSVDDNGAGTVVPRVVGMNLKGEVLGQQGELVVKNGQTHLTINGEPSDLGARLNTKKLNDPDMAIVISKRGHIDSLVPLKKTDKRDNVPPYDDANKQQPAGFDFQRFAGAWVARTLPALWPDRDVNAGDKWSAQIPWSLGAETDKAPLGQFDFQLKGEEKVGTRQLQHILVNGAVTVDEKHAAALMDKADKSTKKKTGLANSRLSSARQKISGDLWFDAQAGQVVRAELTLKSHVEGSLPEAADAQNNNSKRTRDLSTLDFSGTLQVQLRDAA